MVRYGEGVFYFCSRTQHQVIFGLMFFYSMLPGSVRQDRKGRKRQAGWYRRSSLRLLSLPVRKIRPAETKAFFDAGERRIGWI